MKLDDLGGRKFILAMAALILTVALVWFGKIAEGIYSVVIVSVVGAYITGNVTQRVMSSTASVTATKEPPAG